MGRHLRKSNRGALSKNRLKRKLSMEYIYIYETYRLILRKKKKKQINKIKFENKFEKYFKHIS